MLFQNRRLECSVPGSFSFTAQDRWFSSNAQLLNIFVLFSLLKVWPQANYCPLFKPYSESRVIDFVMDFLIVILTNVYEHFTNNLSSQLSSKEPGKEGVMVVKD